MGWNSGALGEEIVCEAEKTVRFYRNAVCGTAYLPADTVLNLEKDVVNSHTPLQRVVVRAFGIKLEARAAGDGVEKVHASMLADEVQRAARE